MPIGWLPGDGGGATPARPPQVGPRPPDPQPDDAWDRWREAVPLIWERWQTRGDERVCPICGPLAGMEFPGGAGPTPPLHPNCRCQREVSRVEWVMREVGEG
jgi:hypothetical protein